MVEALFEPIYTYLSRLKICARQLVFGKCPVSPKTLRLFNQKISSHITCARNLVFHIKIELMGPNFSFFLRFDVKINQFGRLGFKLTDTYNTVSTELASWFCADSHGWGSFNSELEVCDLIFNVGIFDPNTTLCRIVPSNPIHLIFLLIHNKSPFNKSRTGF